jgi:amino acid transporter
LAQVEKNNADGHNTLGRHLKARDLAAFGIAAIIRAGILAPWKKPVLVPAVIFLFLFTAIACSFAAFAYAEFIHGSCVR